MNNKRLSSGSSWGLPRGRPAGVADILEICWASKNALEKAASLTAVENIAKTLRAELSSYSRKNSVAMSGEVALQRWAPLVGELVKCRNICYNMG